MHAPLAEDKRDLAAQAERVIDAAFQRADLEPVPMDEELIARIVTEQRGIPFPILSREQSIDGYLANARIIENTIENTVEPAVVETAALETTASN